MGVLWSVVPVLLAGTLLSVFGEEYGWRIGPKEIRRFCCAARLLFLTEMVRSVPIADRAERGVRWEPR